MPDSKERLQAHKELGKHRQNACRVDLAVELLLELLGHDARHARVHPRSGEATCEHRIHVLRHLHAWLRLLHWLRLRLLHLCHGLLHLCHGLLHLLGLLLDLRLEGLGLRLHKGRKGLGLRLLLKLLRCRLLLKLLRCRLLLLLCESWLLKARLLETLLRLLETLPKLLGGTHPHGGLRRCLLCTAAPKLVFIHPIEAHVVGRGGRGRGWCGCLC